MSWLIILLVNSQILGIYIYFLKKLAHFNKLKSKWKYVKLFGRIVMSNK